jgi:hypothetical protein
MLAKKQPVLTAISLNLHDGPVFECKLIGSVAGCTMGPAVAATLLECASDEWPCSMLAMRNRVRQKLCSVSVWERFDQLEKFRGAHVCLCFLFRFHITEIISHNFLTLFGGVESDSGFYIRSASLLADDAVPLQMDASLACVHRVSRICSLPFYCRIQWRRLEMS